MDAPGPSWCQRLTLRFEDGTSEVLFLDMSLSGRHKPRVAQPADWTRLDFARCPCCSLAASRHCPPAVSLEETLMGLRGRASTEVVTATALDGRLRSTSVRWPLLQVGGTLVQIALFCTGCPVGDRFRSLLGELSPLSTSRELGRHLARQYLMEHHGDSDASAHAVLAALAPLREACTHLFRRLQGLCQGGHDAIPNSIVHVHALTLNLGVSIKGLIAEIEREML